MILVSRSILAFFICSFLNVVYAQDISLLPKYGLLPKSEALIAADKSFIAAMDEQFKGDRKKAADEVSIRGWQYLKAGNATYSMRRFNEAWLLDNTNGYALWGMAVNQVTAGKLNESLSLFSEADLTKHDDVDFSVDYARAQGFVGAQKKNQTLLNEAFAHFSKIYDQAPDHTLNLQNWAITLFYVGHYTEAWQKIKLAEATPRSAEIDKSFIAALQSKMPRPS